MREEAEFTIQDLIPIAITFVVAAIVIGYGATILRNMQTSTYTETATCNETSATYTNCNGLYNATRNGMSGLTTFGSNLPLLATIVVAAIIIGILIVYLGGSMMKN